MDDGEDSSGGGGVEIWIRDQLKQKLQLQSITICITAAMIQATISGLWPLLIQEIYICTAMGIGLSSCHLHVNRLLWWLYWLGK